MTWGLAGLLATLAIHAASATEDRVELYRRHVVPPTWQQVARGNANQRMTFVVAVKQQNLDILEKKFWAVSDPKSKYWRSYMKVEEIDSIVGSKAEDLAMVEKWVSAHLPKSAHYIKNADSIEVHCSVADVEQLFQATIYSFTHDNGHTILRTFGAHSIPKDVHAAIDFVEGIADFPMHRAPAKKVKKGPREAAAGQEALVAPQTLLEMYKVPEASKASVVSQGAAEFQDDTSYNKEDLVAFFKQTELPDQSISDTVGPYNGADPDTEASLDIQYITSVGQKQVNWYWTANNWMYQWSQNFYNNKAVPDAISISWGWAEDQQCKSGISQAECQTLGIDAKQYVQRVNTEFQKIGLRGVSIFVASGDSGANGRSDGQCTDKVLHASFPGSSPYVTTVGATMLQNPKFDLVSPPSPCSSQGSSMACASGGTEVAVSSELAGFTSGGGFSTYTPMPKYQEAAVQAYLKEESAKLPPSTYFKATNRAYPDIAAMGHNFLVYMSSQGGWSKQSGTSAAAPTIAGVMSRLNDLSYQKSGKPMGFLNQFLYQMHAEAPEAFTDVTVGDNICTEEGCSPGCKGFYAAKGWDPVTGLGTPVADKMIAYLSKQIDFHAFATANAAEMVV